MLLNRWLSQHNFCDFSYLNLGCLTRNGYGDLLRWGRLSGWWVNPFSCWRPGSLTDLLSSRVRLDRLELGTNLVGSCSS
jgi:hypothetical protein